MTDASDNRRWTTAGLSDTAEALVGLSGAAFTSLMLEVMARRAAARGPADVLRQFERDTFTPPAAIDLRAELRAELALLNAAAGFEAIALSPLAPFAACAAVGPTSQHKVVSTVRGSEVVSDPTNVLALECARRLRGDPDAVVRLATCQRVVRAQAVPKKPGFAHHFKIFTLATAGLEREGHARLIEALIEHVATLWAGLDALSAEGYAIRRAPVRLLATPARATVTARIAEGLRERGIEAIRGALEHPYYSGGVRFSLDVEMPDGSTSPLADGGAFDWVGRLTANRRHVFVASGLGTQLVLLALRGEKDRPGASAL